MLQTVQVDSAVSIAQQLGEQTDEPVILVNTITVAPADVEAMLGAWADDARWFKRQPGFISTQLHRGASGSTTFLNYAVWESVAAFRTAFSDPAFREKLAAYPEGSSAPHLYRKVAVEGVCVR